MRVCIIFTLCFLIIPLNANFGITYLSPNTTTTTTTNQFILQINQTVNRPAFPAFIQFYNATNSSLIGQIDVHNNTNVTYLNYTLTFYLPNSVTFNVNDEFYITFDTGVLFSNGTNSTVQTSSNFWHLKVINLQTSTSALTTAYTSMQTTYDGTTATSMSSNATSAVSMTTMMTSFTSVNQTSATNLINTTVATTAKVIQGESPPTRSAQLGMGLGITFIAIIIIIEIVYFTYCYDGDGRSGGYFP